MDVLRAVAYAFRMAQPPFRITCGLIGAISYDFIDQFERLPASPNDLLHNPDYELYFADNIFLMDHKSGKSYVIVNAIITDDDRKGIAEQVQDCFQSYFEALQRPGPHRPTGPIPVSGRRDGHIEGSIRRHGSKSPATYRGRGHLSGGPEPNADGTVPR